MAGDQPSGDHGALLASRLRSLPPVSRQASIVRTSNGWQANCQVDGGFHVYIHPDPVAALLVATGAIPHPNLSDASREITRLPAATPVEDTARRIASLNAQADFLGKMLSAEDMELLG